MTGGATDDDATGGKLEADGFAANDKKGITRWKIRDIGKISRRIVC